MRDLLSKLDNILVESALNPKDPKGDYTAKKQALDDLEADPVASEDPEISSAIKQRRADLEKEAATSGVEEDTDPTHGKTPRELGAADAYYGRNFIHMVQDYGFKPGTEEFKEYSIGFSSETDSKDYGHAPRRQQAAPPGPRMGEAFEIGDDFGISFSEEFEIGSEIIGFTEDGIIIQLDDRSISYLTNEGFTFEEGELTEGVAGPKSCWKGHRKVGTQPGTGKNAGKSVNDCEKIGEELDEYFFFPDTRKRSEKNRDANKSQDTLGRRPEGGIAKHGNEYKSLKKKGDSEDRYPISGPKGKLPEESDIELEAKYQGREVPLGKPMAGDVKKSKVYVKNPQGNVVKVNFGDKKMRIKKSNPSRRKSFRARHNCSNPGPRHKARYWSCKAW